MSKNIDTSEMPGQRLAVAQICHSSLGGSSRVAGRIANALARRNHTSHVLSLDPVFWDLHEDVVQHNCHATPHGNRGELNWDWNEEQRDTFCSLVCNTIRDNRFDLLHYHFAFPFAEIMARAAHILGPAMPPCIGTFHGTDLLHYVDRIAKGKNVQAFFSGTDKLTTVSSSMARLCRDHVPFDIGLEIVPNFVEDDWPAQAASGQLVTNSSRPVMLHVSNFRSVKDVDLLATIFCKTRQLIDVELWLVGEGPQLANMRQNLSTKTPAGTVRYWGEQKNPAQFFRKADIFISTSKSEGFGLAVLEAMASGLPIVATPVGGIVELLEDNRNGVSVDRDNLDESIARIGHLLQSTSRLEEMGRECLAAAKKYREAAVFGRFEALYSDTVVNRSN